MINFAVETVYIFITGFFQTMKKNTGLLLTSIFLASFAYASESGTDSHAVAEMAAEADSLRFENLQEVTITGVSGRQRMREVRLGTERLELAKMAQLPSFMGENDIIKGVSLMPGVHGEGEGSGGFEVRGGNASQNLIQIDGITLYNPTHVMGVFSTFNDDAIGNAVLYKGPIPAVYGGVTAGVLETSLAPGDMQDYNGSLTVGLLAAKIKAAGPIVKDRLSFAVTARRSYVDAFLQMVPEYSKTVMNFYDLTAKMRYIPKSGQVLDMSFMMGHDNMAIKNVMGMYWGNSGASVNWSAYAGDSWKFITTGSLTHYNPKMTMSVMETDQTLYEYIRDYSLNGRAQWNASDNHTIEFGLRSQLLRVKSAETILNGHRQRDIRSGVQNAVWVNYSGEFGSRFAAEAGVRLNIFTSLSGLRMNHFEAFDEPWPDTGSKTYPCAEPRLSMRYGINDNHSLKLGAGFTSQCIHALRSSTTSFPFDRYILSSRSVRPERGTQYVAGYTGATPSGSFDWSVEGYYRSVRNVYDYKDGMGMFSAINAESVILGGKGRGFGLELMFRKNTGRLTGWVAYTLSKTESRIPGINGGRWYDAGNDRRHDLKITAIYKIADRWNVSGAWVYSSGQPLTVPDMKYELSGVTCYYYSQRNGYRTPDTHRLDISATYTHAGKKFTYEWSFGVYNAYCRYNPYMIYFEDDSTKPSGTQAVQQSLYGILPFVSYTLRF